MCRPQSCGVALLASRDGKQAAAMATAGVAPLLAILRREFADHPMELAVAERWAQQLAGTGPGAVAAGREIVELRAKLRAGSLPSYDGPITIDDEIRALVEAIIRAGVAERLDKLEADATEVGWDVAMTALRAEVGSTDTTQAEVAERLGVL